MEELSNIEYSLSKNEFVVLAALKELDQFYGIEMDVDSYDDVAILNTIHQLAVKGAIENHDHNFRLLNPYDSMFDYLKYSDLVLSIVANYDEFVPSFIYLGSQLLLIKNDILNPNRLLLRLMDFNQMLIYMDDMGYLDFDRYSEPTLLHLDCKRISTGKIEWELHINRVDLDYIIFGKKDAINVEQEYQKEEFFSLIRKWI